MEKKTHFTRNRILLIIYTFQYEEKSVYSRQDQATENDPGFDKAGTNKRRAKPRN
jgi:hypothetical protein